MELTVCRRARRVPTKVLWRARRRIQTWRALRSTSQLGGHAMGRIAVLRRRGKAGAALVGAASHYAAEEVAGSMADLGRLWLRGAVVVRALAGAAALLDLALELSDAVFIPAPRLGGGSLAGTGRARHGGRVLGLHLVVLALERVDLATDKLDLIDVAGNCPAG